MPRATVTALRLALQKFIRAFEAMEQDEVNEDMWNAYAEARILLGDPVKTYRGGYEDHHIHPYLWNAEDDCDACDAYAEEQSDARG